MSQRERATTGEAPGARAVGKRLAGSLAAVVLLLALVEFAVDTFDVAPPRPVPILFWNPRQDAALEDEESAFRADPRWLWELRPSGNVNGVPINADGYRSRAVPRERGTALRSPRSATRRRSGSAWPRTRPGPSRWSPCCAAKGST